VRFGTNKLHIRSADSANRVSKRKSFPLTEYYFVESSQDEPANAIRARSLRHEYIDHTLYLVCSVGWGMKVQHFNGNATRDGNRAESKAKNRVIDIVANSKKALLSSFVTGCYLFLKRSESRLGERFGSRQSSSQARVWIIACVTEHQYLIQPPVVGCWSGRGRHRCETVPNSAARTSLKITSMATRPVVCSHSNAVALDCNLCDASDRLIEGIAKNRTHLSPLSWEHINLSGDCRS